MKNPMAEHPCRPVVVVEPVMDDGYRHHVRMERRIGQLPLSKTNDRQTNTTQASSSDFLVQWRRNPPVGREPVRIDGTAPVYGVKRCG